MLNDAGSGEPISGAAFKYGGISASTDSNGLAMLDVSLQIPAPRLITSS
jgi:hypothetical protein